MPDRPAYRRILRPRHLRLPTSAAEAIRRLETGNREFQTLMKLGPGLVGSGAGAKPGAARRASASAELDPATVGPPAQQPFAAVLACSDARVPTELVFRQSFNELFVVRVAGNVLSSEGLGSMDYAIQHFPQSLRLLVVLAHNDCGAVTAAVDAFLAPVDYLAFASSQPLRSILDRLFIAVRGAARALHAVHGPGVVERPGYRAALIELAVIANASLTAYTLQQEFRTRGAEAPQAVYGVYDLDSGRVRVPAGASGTAGSTRAALAFPPADTADFLRLGRATAQSERVRGLLETVPR